MEPVFLTEDTSDKQIKLLEDKTAIAGVYGEKRVRFELQNSHIPMYVIQDVVLEYEDLKAQIDFLVVCSKGVYVLECKNLIGNIEVTEDGSFIRDVNGNREGFYSPVTQNQRHIDLVRRILQVRYETIDEKAFDEIWQSVIVLTNPKTILECHNEEVAAKLVRADQLITHIKDAEEKTTMPISTDREMKYAAESWLPKCPVCGSLMVRRISVKGERPGEAFWGCPNYPDCRGVRR